MTLDTFEKKLSSSIQKQAYTFFTQKKVDELEQTGDKWVAFVRGKDNDFDATATVKNKTITSHSCDCDSDELICEHVAALLYAVQAHTEGTPSKTKIAKSVVEKAAKPKKPAKPETFTELLEKVPADELRAFLKENFARNKDFKSIFMARFTVSSSSVEGGREKFLTLVENTMKIGFDRSGYADWQGLKKMLKPLKMLVTQGKKMLANSEYMDAAYMGEALMLKISEKLGNVYDPNDLIEYASNGLEIMEAVFQTDAPQNLKDTIWNTLLALSSTNVFFKYSNLGYDIYNALIINADDAKKENAFITATTQRLVALKANTKNDDYENKHITKKISLLQLELYKHRGNTTAAQHLIAKNLDIPEIRQIEVEMLIKAKDYAKAKSIIFDSIQSERNHNLIFEAWRTLLQIAQLENDEPEIRRLAKELWEKSGNTTKYYRLYKSTYDSKVWTKLADDIIEDHKKSKKEYAYILIEEERWAQLLERVTDLATESQRGYIWGVSDYDIMAKYDSYLLPHFPEELTQLYKDYIYKSALNATDRSAYFSVGLKLKRFATYPNQLAAANQLTNALMSKYANRPAFVEELGKLKLK
jgi:hypothetical protein